MTETELQEQVRAYCADLGLFHYHTHDSRHSAKGFPDSFIMNKRTGQIMFRELKNATRQATGEQKAFAYACAAGGHDWALWRPADLDSRRILTELCDLAGRSVLLRRAGL
jgi:S-formylglutathione hydrolase FrmB